MTATSQFRKFLVRILAFGSPVILLVLSYFILDPFHVLYHYDGYPDNYLKTYNRNRIGTEVFLQNNPQQHYRSFIFGSSRSGAFLTRDWSGFINDPQPYHFDAFNEVISGIYGKVRFIKSQGNRIDNALVLIDHETFNYPVDTAHSIIHIQDYRWTNEHWVSYQVKFFKSFFKDLFFVKYMDVKLFGKYRPYMKTAFTFEHHYYAPVSNDFIFKGNMDRINKDSLAYYRDKEVFFERKKEKQVLPKAILDYQLKFLREMKDIFDRDGTDYRIVIAPVYDFKYYHPDDLKILREIFGSDHVYDYSGVNSYTIPVSNYYEAVHFKPYVGKAILQEIYTKDPVRKK